MDESLQSILERFWQWRIDDMPELGTMVGDHRNDGLLDDMGLSAYDKRLQKVKDFIAELERVDKKLLNKENVLNYELLSNELSNYVDGMKLKCYLCPVNGLEGPQVDFRKSVSWMKTDTVEDFHKILSRYERFPKQIDQIIALFEKGMEIGIVNAKVAMEKVPDQFVEIAKVPVKESEFYEPFKAITSSINDETRTSLQQNAVAAIEGKLYPAYLKISKFIKDTYLPACRDNISCTSLPSGKKLYEMSLRFHLSTTMSADEVHQTGLNEVLRIKTRMFEVMKEVKFTGTFEEFLKHLKDNKNLYLNKKDDLMAMYNNTCKEIDKLLPKYFKTLPKMNYVIKEMSVQSATLTAAFYNAGSLEGRPGTFYVNTYNFEKMPTYSCPSLCLHEAVPGHHHQSSIAIEQTKLPAFRRYLEDRQYYSAPARFALYGSYIEGWGLYSEYLGEEMNMYKTPYDLFGRLSHEMFRACRCVVDTGMHAKGWSRQQAVDYLAKNTGLPDHEIQVEINRYITWPGQACGYKIGEIKIKELRKKAETTLGEKFDLKEFHDVILLESAVPLWILEQLVNEYITRNMR